MSQEATLLQQLYNLQWHAATSLAWQCLAWCGTSSLTAAQALTTLIDLVILSFDDSVGLVAA